MKKILIASILTVFISGCEITMRQPPANTIVTRTPTITAQSTVEPSDAMVIPSPSAAIETSIPNPLFHDDFNSTLQPGWEWQNEKSENWSLLAVPGFLQINVTRGYVNLNNVSNLLLRPAPHGDFQFETNLLFFPSRNNQFAGLIIYESDKNFIQAGYSYCDPIYGCVGSGLYMDVYQDGKLQLPRNPMEYENDNIYLRLMRQGSTIYFLASTDGIVWFRINSYTTSMNGSKIGIVTGQNLRDTPVPIAVFEYFQVSHLD